MISKFTLYEPDLKTELHDTVFSLLVSSELKALTDPITGLFSVKILKKFLAIRLSISLFGGRQSEVIQPYTAI